jgi:hypothetical protein
MFPELDIDLLCTLVAVVESGRFTTILKWSAARKGFPNLSDLRLCLLVPCVPKQNRAMC